jgi:hypothetical protein
MSIIFALEGVLRTETGDPIPEGIKLYRSLAPNYRIVIASDISKLATEHWLKTNFIVDYADVLDSSYSYEGMDLRERQLEYARTQGVIEMMIDGDADRCAHAVSVGVHALFFTAPKYVRRKREVRKWDDITDVLAKQREAVAEEYARASNNSLYDEVD